MKGSRLAVLLLLALALRAVAVFCSRGYEFVDQQFQYVDPAWGLATKDAWWQSWEWKEGIRSWAYPGMLAGVFEVGLALGVRDPQALMVFVRGVHALVSLLPIAALWLVLARWRNEPRAGTGVLLAAASFVLVYAGVQPSGLAFAVGFSVASVLLFHGHNAWPFLSGICLGIAFACRFQDAMLGPVLFVCGLAQRRWRACLWLCAGSAVPVVAQGLLDVATWGSFLHSAFAYVRVNVFEGKSAEFGTSPAWTYAGILAAVFLPVVPEAWRIFVAGTRAVPVPMICGLSYVLLHTFIARRQMRFVLPGIALLQIVWIVGYLRTTPKDRVSLWYRRVVLYGHALALVLASVWYFHRGPIEAALVLRREPNYVGNLLAVGMGGEGIGGAYWLGRRQLELEYLLERKQLASHLRARPGPWPIAMLVKGDPLAPGELGPGFSARELARTADWPDWRAGSRRQVLLVGRERGGESREGK